MCMITTHPKEKTWHYCWKCIPCYISVGGVRVGKNVLYKPDVNSLLTRATYRNGKRKEGKKAGSRVHCIALQRRLLQHHEPGMMESKNSKRLESWKVVVRSTFGLLKFGPSSCTFVPIDTRARCQPRLHASTSSVRIEIERSRNMYRRGSISSVLTFMTQMFWALSCR